MKLKESSARAAKICAKSCENESIFVLNNFFLAVCAAYF